MSTVLASSLGNIHDDQDDDAVFALCRAAWGDREWRSADSSALDAPEWSWPRIVVGAPEAHPPAWRRAWEAVLREGHEVAWMAPLVTICEYRCLPAMPWAQPCPGPADAPYVIVGRLWVTFLSCSPAARKRFTAVARGLGVMHAPRTNPTFVDVRSKVLDAIRRDRGVYGVLGRTHDAVKAVRDSITVEDLVEAGATEQAVERVYGRRLSPEESQYRAKLIVERRRTPQPLSQRDVTARVREEIARMECATLTEMIDNSRRWLDTGHNENARRIKVNRALLALERDGYLKTLGIRGGAKIRGLA